MMLIEACIHVTQAFSGLLFVLLWCSLPYLGIGSSAKNSEQQMDIKGTLFLRKDSLEEDEEAASQLDLILSEDFRELLSMPEDFVTSDAEIQSLQKGRSRDFSAYNR